MVVPDAAALAQFEDILREELNVKAVELVELAESTAAEYGITHRLSVNARAAGPRLGKQVQQAIQAAKAGDWSRGRRRRHRRAAIALEPGEYELVLETAGRPEGEALALLAGGGFVLLDTTTTPELEAEGLARDVIRAVQDTRKAAGFDVSDRIRLELAVRRRRRTATPSPRRSTSPTSRARPSRSSTRCHGPRRRASRGRAAELVGAVARREPTTPASSRRARSPTRATSPSP